MFPFYCSLCSRNSMSAGRPRCLQCGYAEPSPTMDDDSNPTEPEAPSQYGVASGSKNHLHPNDTELVCTNDRKRNEDEDQMLPDNSEGHFDASKGKRMRPVNEIRAVPGPSGFHQNKNASNLSAEKSQSGSTLEPQSVALIDEKAIFCVNCRWEMDRHSFELEGETVYKCCSCSTFIRSGMVDLQKHAIMHDPSFPLCNICGEFKFETDAHGSERKCEACNEKFQCRTLLEDHSLVHEDYFFVYCRYCPKKIADHITTGQNNFYKCCECDYETYYKHTLRNHLYTHTDLKLYKCDICGRRFTRKTSLPSHLAIHFTCKKCKDSFTSVERLEEHFKQVHTRA